MWQDKRGNQPVPATEVENRLGKALCALLPQRGDLGGAPDRQRGTEPVKKDPIGGRIQVKRLPSRRRDATRCQVVWNLPVIQPDLVHQNVPWYSEQDWQTSGGVSEANWSRKASNAAPSQTGWTPWSAILPRLARSGVDTIQQGMA